MTLNMKSLSSGAQKGCGRPPQRTGKEMAEEFGVTPSRLGILLRHYRGPTGMRHSGGGKAATWYDPKTMRAWWATLPETVKKGGPAC